MTLESAIQHLKESLADPTHKWGCEECKQEHEQLLEWLEDYQKVKEENKKMLITIEEFALALKILGG
jgi:hypothetical protein